MVMIVKCNFTDGVICDHEGPCASCIVWDKVLDQTRLDLDICPVCGADREEYRRKFGNEHVCYAGGD